MPIQPMRRAERCRRSSCRESEGVPQFFFHIPQDWGIQGVGMEEERRYCILSLRWKG
jgi:hypothetical protein